MRELLGSDAVEIELSGGARLADVDAALRDRFPATAEILDRTKFARNGILARLDDELVDGDEVALLPPVGGG